MAGGRGASAAGGNAPSPASSVAIAGSYSARGPTSTRREIVAGTALDARVGRLIFQNVERRRTNQTGQPSGTVAAFALGVLATIGSALFGLANLRTVFQVRAARSPSTATVPVSIP